MKITILGDVCPTVDTQERFQTADVQGLFGDLLPALQSSDLVVANLECALTDTPHPIDKAGPVLHAPVQCIKALRDAGVRVLSLANNHIRDCGTQGVLSTLQACHDADISTVGAGPSLADAQQPLVLEVAGQKVGIIAFAEHEFDFATRQRAGANWLDVYTDFDALRALRAQVDLLIVLYHGGIEYHPYPSPLLQRKCRKMADCGADVVLCQHSHCVGTIEHYGGNTIVYGQGNTLFGYRKGDDGWNTGMAITIEMETGPQAQVSYQMMTMTPSGLQFLQPDVDEMWRHTLAERTAQVTDDTFVEKQWLDFCRSQESLNLPLLFGWPRLLVAMNRRMGNIMTRLYLNRHRANIVHNLLRCEAHHEVIDTILHQHDYD